MKNPQKIFILINGIGSVGKDSFVDACKRITDNMCRDEEAIKIKVLNFSTITPIVNVTESLFPTKQSTLFWKGKDEAYRELLHGLKQILMDNYGDEFIDEFINHLFESINGISQRYDKIVSFIHIREPQQMRQLSKQIQIRFTDNVEVRSLLIDRKDVESLRIESDDRSIVNIFDYNFCVMLSDLTTNDARDFLQRGLKLW